MALRCFSPADAELYARGYPHLVLLDDDHPANAKVPAALAKLYKDYFGAYHVTWPRGVALAFVRAMPIDPTLVSEPALAAAANRAELAPDEVPGLVRAVLARKARSSHHLEEQWLWCLEALAGTDRTLDAVTRELVALPADRIGVPTAADLDDARVDATWPVHDAIPAMIAYLAGYLLLRASKPAAVAARTALEALWQRTVAAGASLEEHSPRGALDLALHGQDGAARVLPPSHWQYLHWWGFVEDADMLLARFTAKWKSEWHPDMRLAWLGGERVLEALTTTKNIRRCGKQRLAFLEDLGKLDHPAVAAAMAEWRDDARAGEYATRWLAEHRGKAKPKPKPTAKPKPKR